MTKTQKQLMEIAKNIFKVNKPEHKLWDICKCDECITYRDILERIDKSLLAQKIEDKKKMMEIIQRIFYKEGKEFPIASIDRVFELKNSVEEI